MNRKEMAVMLHGKGFTAPSLWPAHSATSWEPILNRFLSMLKLLALVWALWVHAGRFQPWLLVTGMKLSDGNMDDPKTKRQCYDMMKTLTGEFEKKNSSIICSQLKGVDTGTPLRSCNGCIEDAVELLDKYLLGTEE